MRRLNIYFTFAATLLLQLGAWDEVMAQCVVPQVIANGQPTDATRVMANFNALVTCLGAVAASATNSIQYNSGSGVLGGIGPLTNGQVLIGATGAAPQAQNLTAGTGITVTNGPGAITLSATGPGPTGLFNQAMSATPTSANTGLANWLNKGTAVFTDSAVGLCLNIPSSGGSVNVTGRFMVAPTPPYKITALVAATRDSNSFNSVGLGWYDGSSKIHALSYLINGGGSPFFQVQRYNNVTSGTTADEQSSINAFAQPIWLQIQDDGTNVTFSFSQDGSNFVQLFSVAKSAGWLGSSGYNNVLFFANPQGSQTLATIMSWSQS
jgi:hypothetical protein